MFNTPKKEEYECYVIAEAGLNHNGSVNIAKKLIDSDPDYKKMIENVMNKNIDVSSKTVNGQGKFF